MIPDYRVEHRGDDGQTRALLHSTWLRSATVAARTWARVLHVQGKDGLVAVVDHRTGTDVRTFPVAFDAAG
jgi:hypothetical protein